MEQETILHIEGTVEQVLYRNEQNGYTVLDLDANGTLITVVGELGDVEEGEQLSVGTVCRTKAAGRCHQHSAVSLFWCD